MITIREMTSQDNQAWDQFLETSPQSNIFHRLDVSRMLCDTDRRLKRLHLGCFEDGKLVGGQIVYFTLFLGVPLPTYTHYLYYIDTPILPAPAQNGKIHSTRKTAHEVMTSLARELENRIGFVEFMAHPSLEDARPYQFLGWSVKQDYSSAWNLKALDTVLASMAARKRRYIRSKQNALKVDVEPSGKCMDEFLAIYRVQINRFNLPASSQWEEIFRQRAAWWDENGTGRMYTLRDREGKLLAGYYVLFSPIDRKVYGYRQAVRQDCPPGVNDAAQWQIANQLPEEYDCMEFGGGHTRNLAQYKDAIGGELIPYFSIHSITGKKRLDWIQRLRKWRRMIWDR